MAAEGSDQHRPASGVWPKLAMILPLVVFFVLGAGINTEPVEDGQQINAHAYLVLTASRVLLMSATVVWLAREILRQFPPAVDYRGILFGLLGAVIWIGTCSLELERSLIDALGLSQDWLPARESVNPFDVYATSDSLLAFLAVRFSLLVICVPIAEELFLRGFVMRAVEVEDWTELPLQQIGTTGLVMGTVYGIATHPAEWIAAALWFTLITLLMVRSGKFWNCVVAHAITNLILGIYVCLYAQWHLW